MIIEGNVRNKLLIIGIVFLILGIIFYVGRVGIAATFSGTRVSGLNRPYSISDFKKIRKIASIGGILFIVGLTLTITGLLKDRNKEEKEERKTAYGMNEKMETELSEIVSTETKKIAAVQEEVISNINGIEALRQLLFEKGIVSEQEFLDKFRKIAKEMKEKRGKS